MPSDRQIVTAMHLLSALRERERLGAEQALRRLESAEPDLTEHVMEALSRLQRDLFDAGVGPRRARRIAGRVEAAAVVAVAALRAAHAELWSDIDEAETQTERDPSDSNPASPPPGAAPA